MHRRYAMGTLAAASALVWGAAVNAQDLADVEIETIAVADGIYMMTGQGGNLGLSIGEDGAFLIDSQFAPLSERIQEAIAGVTDQEVTFLVNTHWHGDHTGGNEPFREDGAIIVAHENVRERMSTEQFREIMDQTIEPSPEGALPVVTFPDSLTFHWNGETIEVFHVGPAHTDGDAMILFRDADVLHMGDIYFNGTYPFVDVDSGGNIDGVIAAVERVLDVAGEDTQIIPGHGPLSDREELAEYARVLRTARNDIRTLLEQGYDEDEVVAMNPTAEFDEQWGMGFMNPENFTRLVYRSLAGGSGVQEAGGGHHNDDH